MVFVKTEDLKVGMRLAKPIYNKNGVMLYERDSKLSSQGIISIKNFGLIGLFILEPAEPVPPMSEEDIAFERFQTMAVFQIKDILEETKKGKESKTLFQFANQIIKNYGTLHHKVNFIQNLRSKEDYVYKHCLNTAILCALISKKMNLDFKRQLDVVVAAILHDMGRLMLPLDLRFKEPEELSEQEEKIVFNARKQAYQLFSQNHQMETGVRNVLLLTMSQMFDFAEQAGKIRGRKLLEVEILQTAIKYDEMTAMQISMNQMSDLAAVRYLLEEENGFNQRVVNALIESICILEPGVCVEMSNGEKGLVVAAGAVNVLEPFVLGFRSNTIHNLGDSNEQLTIKDIMKTMDNRHVMDPDLLKQYEGKVVKA